MAYPPALSRFRDFKDTDPLGPSFKCIFPPKTKPNTPCGQRVRRDNQSTAKSLQASIMSSLDAGMQIDAELKEYAQLLCCGRHHEQKMRELPSLLEALARRWTVELKAAHEASRSRPQTVAPTTIEPAIEAAVTELEEESHVICQHLERQDKENNSHSSSKESDETQEDSNDDDAQSAAQAGEDINQDDTPSLTDETSSACSGDEDSSSPPTPKTDLASTMIIKSENEGEAKLIIDLKALETLSTNDIGRKLLEDLLPAVRREVPNINQNTCKICYDADINAAFIDCGHSCSCYECAKDLEKCPICRKEVISVLRIYKA